MASFEKKRNEKKKRMGEEPQMRCDTCVLVGFSGRFYVEDLIEAYIRTHAPELR